MFTDDTVAGKEQVEIFMGVAITSGKKTEVIQYFDPGLSVEYELARTIRTVGTPTKKVLGVVKTELKVMGDFNMFASSPLYDRIVGPIAPGMGRMNNPEGFVDAWVAAGHGEGEGATCHSGSLSTGRRIDFCFVSASLAGRIRRAWIDDKAQGSDHQPIWTEVDL